MGYRLQDAVAMARHQLDGLLRDSGAHVVDRIDLKDRGPWGPGIYINGNFRILKWRYPLVN